MSLQHRTTGLTVLDHANQPVSASWTFSSTEDDSLRTSERTTFTLEPGEYALVMDISDDTTSITWANPEETDGTVDVNSSVRASVFLNSY